MRESLTTSTSSAVRPSLGFDFLSIAEGEADVVIGVDRQVIDESVEGIEGEFRQALGRVFECLEEVLVPGFPGLSFFDFCGELFDAGLELIVPVGKVVVALLIGVLVESRPGVLHDVLLHCVRHHLCLIQEPVAFGFQFVGLEEER